MDPSSHGNKNTMDISTYMDTRIHGYHFTWKQKYHGYKYIYGHKDTWIPVHMETRIQGYQYIYGNKNTMDKYIK